MDGVGIRIKATDEASGVFGKVAAEAGKLQGAVSAVSGGFAALGGVAAAAAAGIGFATQIKDAIDLADSFNKLSQKSGVAVESLSRLNYAAGLADVSTEALSTGLKKLNVSISAAAGGSAEKAALFKALGVSVKDAAGNVLSADKVMAQLADSFADSGDTANKAAVAVELFGKAGTDLIPLLNAGSKGLNEMGDEAQKLGIVLGTEFAKNAEEFNDNLHKISVSGQGLFVTLAGDLVKGLGAAAKAASEAAIEGGKLAAVYAGLQALFTGDDMHKANVAMVQGVEVLMAAENALDKARATGDTARIERLTKAVALRKEELKVTQNYRAMLEADAKKREEDNKPKPTQDSKAIKDAAAAIAKRTNAPKETGNAFAAEQDAAKEWAKALESAGKFVDDLTAKNLDLGKSEAALKVYMESTAAAINEKTNPAMNDMVKAAYQANIALEAMGKLADVIEAQQRRTSTAQDETQKERERVAAIGLTTQAVAELGATRLEELAIAKERTLLAADEIDLSGELSEAIKGEVKALRERAGLLRTGAIKENAVEAAKASAEEWKRGWEQTDQIAREAFSAWTEDGSSAAKKIGDTLKKALLSAIYEATLKPLVFQLYTSVAGGGNGVGGLVAGGQSGMGGLFNSASNLNTLYGAGSQFLYGGTAGASNASLLYANSTQAVGGDGLGALIQGNGGWQGVNVGASGTAASSGTSTGALSGAGSSALAFIPLLLAAYGAGKDSFRVSSTGDSTSQFDASGRVINRRNQLFGGDSPVVIPSIVNGVAVANPQTPSSFTTNELALTDGRTQEQLDTLYAAQSATRDAQFAATNAAADRYTEGLNAAYLQAAKNLGVGAVSTNITFGTNDTRGGGGARLGLSAGSRSFDSGDISLNDADLRLAANRAILTALEGSELPRYMQGVFDGVDAAKLDQAGIDAAIQAAVDLKDAYKVLQTIPGQDLTNISFETLNSIKSVATELAVVDNAFFTLGYTLYDVSVAGAAAASDLANAFGSLANFQAQTTALFQNYYTSAEQKANAVNSASSLLSAAGITGFTTADISGASREQIRAVVDQYAARVGTTEGDRQYAAVVSAANLLSNFVPAFESTTQKVAEKVDQLGYSANVGSGGGGSSAPVQDAALSAWQDATDAIVRVMGDLRTTLVDSGPDSFTKLQAQFAIELASAKAGNLSAAEDLPALVQNLAQASKDQFTTSVQRDVFVARLIESLGDVVNVGSAGGNLSNPNYVAGGPQVPATVRTPPTYAYTAPSASSAPAVGADPSLLEEVKALRDELIAIRGSTSAIAISTGKSARILDASANGGQPLGTKVLT